LLLRRFFKEALMVQIQTRSRLVNTLGYLGITLLVVLPLAVLMVRSGHWQQGLLLYAVICAASAVLLLLGLLLLLLPRYRPWRSALLARYLLLLPGTLLLLTVLGSRGDYPPIHDISTDLEDPPVFTHAPSLRGKQSNSLEIKPDSLAQQQQAYPELQSLRTELGAEQAFRRALEVARELGWEVVHRDPENWRIEAVDTTAIMAFKDDIAIRIRSSAEGSVVDLRSVSRVGVGDLGANAARIRAFLDHFAG
jgi:uncharacterized protein (DUF1499 family)